MNVLFVTVAWPNKGANNLYSDLLEEFNKKKHNVYVIQGDGNQIKKTIFSNENEIKVLRVKTGQITKTNPVRKFISLMTLGFRLNKAYKNYYSDLKIDLILFATPPITLSKFLKKIKTKNKAHLYLLLKDIWPYGFVDLGTIKKNRLIWKYFRSHEKRIYKIAEYIGCMSSMGVDFVLENNPNVPREKIEVCPNAIKVPNVVPIKNNLIRRKYKIPDDSTVFLFSGNIGKGHGIEFLANNIKQLSKYEKAFFLIGGAGQYFNKLKNILEEAGLSNSYVYSYLPQEDFEELISSCDVGIILLDKAYSYPQFPSRLLSYLKNKMAVVCAVNKNTDIGYIVENSKCGLTGLHGDDKVFQNNIKLLSENSIMIKYFGENGWNLLQKEYNIEVVYAKIISHFI